MPGHMTSFARSYPELFGSRGIICQHEESVGALAALFKEVCELFPDSERIHIGGDEAVLKNWLDCPECMKYARSLGIDTETAGGEEICNELYVNFINKMAETVLEMGRRPVVWEGFPKEMNRKVSRRIDVMSWENYYQTTPELLDAGFNIINSSWNPMYIVAPDVKWSREEVNAWSVRRWTPVHRGSPFAGSSYECGPCRQIVGGQLQAWGDRIIAAYPDNIEEGVIEERRLVLERLPFLAEHTWNTDRTEPFAELDAASNAGQAILDKIIG